ncbi:MAG: p-aminobenzoic acid synthase [Candidatus Eremiobacteraeota bacterium]|nr:p-aminobenzoic acid synthase [Candidatus Eremiobacteraeota bacterium]
MRRILLVDNYDSFTYNLYQLIARVAGDVPLVVRNDAITLDEIAALEPAAIVLSPGPGRPGIARDVGVCAAILSESRIPVLGVCLGHQALVHAEGGTVERAEPVHGRASAIVHAGTDLFAGIPQRFGAVRYHSLAAAAPLPGTLELTAWTGDGVPMAVRHRSRAAWGVQFHPESICTAYGDLLVANFLRLAEGAATRRPAVAGWMPEVAQPPPAPRARVHHRTLAHYADPEDVFVALYAGGPDAFWLDSSRIEPGLARYSFIGAAREGGTSISYDAAKQQATVRRGERLERRHAGVFDVLADELARIGACAPELGVDFIGGLVGYFGYELKAGCGASDVHRSELPDGMWLLADRVLAFDHERGTVHAIALAHEDDDDACRAWLDEIEANVRAIPAAPPVAAAPLETVVLQLDRTRSEYLSDVERCLEEIRAGESYEICLTAQAETASIADPLDFYRVLRRVSPAPYAAYLRFGEIAVLCSSPERFLRVDPDGVVTSKPIKGTAARNDDAALDQLAREMLRNSVKDRAENLMIVDLLRNDLGRVCEIGTVTVPKLMDVESYATVHQMVSTVRGRLAAGRTALDCVRAAFPGGSMTGAPKLRSMEIIDRLERGPRGIYSGSIGFLSANGCADLNIVIRTAIVTPARTVVGIGGAIVALSDPQAEFDEIVLKAQGILRALLAWQGRPFEPGAYAIEGAQEQIGV